MTHPKMTLLSLAAALCLGAGNLSAGAKAYEFNDGHSTVSFKIQHWQIITKTGFFDTFNGSLLYDPEHIERSSVEVRIATASINTHHLERDLHLRSENFFDVAAYPSMTFKSTKVSPGGSQGAMLIQGDLTIRDVTLPVTLNAKVTGTFVDDDTQMRRLGFEASTTISRKDFGIAWNKSNKAGTFMIDDKVEILIDGGTVKKLSNGDPLPPPIVPVLNKALAAKSDAYCLVTPLGPGKVRGKFTFRQEVEGLLVEGVLDGLTPGKHGFHVHQHGDCGGAAGAAAGPHFNPLTHQHGQAATFDSHAGDLGNLVADANGHATFRLLDKHLKLAGPGGILGRSLVVHASEDDLHSQPAGASGERIACGLIHAATR